MATYKKKDEVEALQYDGTNLSAILTLAGTKVGKTESLKDGFLGLDMGDGMLKIKVTDWLVADGKQLTVISDENFKGSYLVKV